MDPTKKELYTAKRSTNLDISDESISSIWSNIRAESPEAWLLLKVEGMKGVVHASGARLDDLIASLTDDDMYFGVIRVTVDGRTKFYHIYFVGAMTGGMKKGKGSLYKSAVFNGFDGAHGELSFVGGLEETTRSTFLNQIQALTGVGQENILIE